MNVVHEDTLRAFGRLREEAREAYTRNLAQRAAGAAPGRLHRGARAEGRDVRFFPHVVRAPEPHLGLCGVGMDNLKTVNISSGAAVIAAACGVYVHIMGKVTRLTSGVEQALQAVAEGHALGQLRKLIETQNQAPSQGVARLGELLAS